MPYKKWLDPLLPRKKEEAIFLFPLVAYLEGHPGKNNRRCLALRSNVSTAGEDNIMGYLDQITICNLEEFDLPKMLSKYFKDLLRQFTKMPFVSNTALSCH